MLPEPIIKLLLAVLFGAIIGFEREYRSKAAGFRTITMITIGATLFTIISAKLGAPGSPDRIASNIITGIGFIGAGVIFKDGLNLSGLTTAATIWVSAAIGMSIGISEYFLATCTLICAIVILAFFEKLQTVIDNFHQTRMYRIDLNRQYHDGKSKVEAELQLQKLNYRVTRLIQDADKVSFFYTISGNAKTLNQFSEFLVNLQEIKSFVD